MVRPEGDRLEIYRFPSNIDALQVRSAEDVAMYQLYCSICDVVFREYNERDNWKFKQDAIGHEGEKHSTSMPPRKTLIQFDPEGPQRYP